LGGKLQAEANGMRADVERLYAQADQLRTEWLSATDAFGKLVRGNYEAAVAVFSEWIVLEADNPVPYVARGLAYQNAGKTALAAADFQKASSLDPKTTAKMLREIQGKQDDQRGSTARRRKR
jgi:Flp pilus assembly protein TadD